MTQEQLAAALGLHQSQVSRYVRRGMPSDSVPGAKAWIANNVRLTTRSPLYRRQATVRMSGMTPGELFELAVDMINFLEEMTATDPEFDRGCQLLMGAVLCRLPETMLRGVLMPPFVVARIEEMVAAFEAAP